MELFDKKYVHFVWEDKLEGKEGFVADDIADLMADVNDNSCKAKPSKSMYLNAPFHEEGSGTDWQFFYYDPNYKCKRAYAEGKQIQFKSGEREWSNVSGEPVWSDIYEFRIKPEEPKSRRMTYRQASEWVSKNGEIAFSTDIAYVFNHFSYDTEFENKELPEEYRIRHWGSDEWIEPTVDVYEADCKKKEVSE